MFNLIKILYHLEDAYVGEKKSVVSLVEIYPFPWIIFLHHIVFINYDIADPEF